MSVRGYINWFVGNMILKGVASWRGCHAGSGRMLLYTDKRRTVGRQPHLKGRAGKSDRCIVERRKRKKKKVKSAQTREGDIAG